MDLLNRFINLARVFLEGRGLPFLGAGVSMGARAHYAQEILPTVEWMIEQVVDLCLPALVSQEERQRQLFAMLGDDKQPPLSSASALREKLKKLVNNRLGLFCESLNILGVLSHAEVVQAMQLTDFSQLEPTPAHHYIAFLARESLVNEVITTNYDCCLESAVFAAANRKGNGAPPLDHNENRPAVSISNLEHYRQYSARRFDRGTRVAVLRVYKINGCAGALAAVAPYRPSQKLSDTILLTERQLQHMNDRGWARDLLRDRMRSRAFVFSGFGSDEPQVRFTILRLLEEFGPIPGYTSNQVNAIWMHVYEPDLSFSQRQIMASFWDPDKVEAHCFSGRDREHFNGLPNVAADAGRFEADLFWQLLFFFVFLALEEQANRRQIGGTDFFDDLATEHLQQARSQFREWLDPEGIGARVLGDSSQYSGFA